MMQPRRRDLWEQGIVKSYRIGQTVHHDYVLPQGKEANESYLKGSAFWGMLQMMLDRGYEWADSDSRFEQMYLVKMKDTGGNDITWKDAINDFFSIFTNYGTKESFSKRMRMVGYALDILYNFSIVKPNIPFTFFKDENGVRKICYVAIVDEVGNVSDYMTSVYNSLHNAEFVYIYGQTGSISGNYKHIKLTPFSWEEIACFPAKHRLQPKFRKYDRIEKEIALKEISSDGKVRGKYHSLLRTDIMVRYYGWDEGDIIEMIFSTPFSTINENTVFIKQVVTAHPM